MVSCSSALIKLKEHTKQETVLNDAGWYFLLVKVFQIFTIKNLGLDPDSATAWFRIRIQLIWIWNTDDVYSQRAPTCPLLVGLFPAWPVACSSVPLIRIPDPRVKKGPGSQIRNNGEHTWAAAFFLQCQLLLIIELFKLKNAGKHNNSDDIFCVSCCVHTVRSACIACSLPPPPFKPQFSGTPSLPALHFTFTLCWDILLSDSHIWEPLPGWELGWGGGCPKVLGREHWIFLVLFNHAAFTLFFFMALCVCNLFYFHVLFQVCVA